jgi:branched-chain amino acid aminotransferase
MSKPQPFTQCEGDLWINGKFVAVADANLPILSHGLHYASTVFEGEQAYDGKIFKSGQHTRRLMNSCKLLGFELPFDFETFEQAKRETLERSGLQNAYFRAIAWKGSGALGVGTTDNQVHAAISLWEMSPYFGTDHKGLRLDVSDWRRPPPACAPVKAKAAGLYTICTLTKDASLAKGYDDAIMLDLEGRISECTGAHIFFVRDGVLHTPKSDWMIDGITRASVLEIAKLRGIPVKELDLFPKDMADFSECFITGSAVEVVAVREIAGQSFQPGKLSKQIIEDYYAMTHGRLG